jgi:TolB-like protein/class 3 adenylate cyclase/tetratricopeptide (TPR) repeat protein
MVRDRPVRVERRLSAILAADVAGYARLMHNDEEATHTKLAALLADGVKLAITEHGGRIVKNTGDGFLAEFPSAVEAVRAAVQFQTRIKELTISDVEGSRIAFRVGVNIGDLIVEPHDIFGDGVNIAARLESIAEPGGICISSSAYDQVRGKLGFEFTDLGEQNLKNIARPVRAYAVVWDGLNLSETSASNSTHASSPPRFSIVVLPFANIGGDPEQDYFVDGVTESLTTDLSRISGSLVIGRHTAFTYKGKAVDLKKVGRDLNVRYVLEGSVQRGGNRLRVNVQLIDAETGNHLWADRFDKPIADLFDMQDEIVSRLANTLGAQLVTVEARRSKNALHLDAMDLYFQGVACLYKGITPENTSAAQPCFDRALALDPENDAALVGSLAVDLAKAFHFLPEDRSDLIAAAEVKLTNALSLAPENAAAHMFMGLLLANTNRAIEGVAECERALALDRNLANAHAFIGYAKILLCRGAETELHVNEALRLSPRDVMAYSWMLYVGLAKFQIEAYPEAVAWFRRSIEANPNYPIVPHNLAAALAKVGDMSNARAVMKTAMVLNPRFTISRVRAITITISDNPIYIAGRERFFEALRLLGAPEA